MTYLTMTYVKDWGTGRPVVLLHGWPLSADSGDDHALANAGLRTMAYDRRGFGRSDVSNSSGLSFLRAEDTKKSTHLRVN